MVVYLLISKLYEGDTLKNKIIHVFEDLPNCADYKIKCELSQKNIVSIYKFDDENKQIQLLNEEVYEYKPDTSKLNDTIVHVSLVDVKAEDYEFEIIIDFKIYSVKTPNYNIAKAYIDNVFTYKEFVVTFFNHLIK